MVLAVLSQRTTGKALHRKYISMIPSFHLREIYAPIVQRRAVMKSGM